MPTTVLFIGDPHFQVNNIPEVDLFMEKIINLATEKKPDRIIVAGDVLHTHERLHTMALNKAYELIDNMRLIAKTYVLVGNHDYCLGKDVPILLWNGNMKMSQEIKVGDILIGDDGLPRNVINTCTGHSRLFNIIYDDTENIIVNQNHILSLKCRCNKYIDYCKKRETWIVGWLDHTTLKYKLKFFGKSYIKKFNKTPEECKKDAEFFLESLCVDDIYDIPILQYINLPKHVQNILFSYRLSIPVLWEHKKIDIEPYILGCWLGNGYKDGKGFVSTDIEPIIEWCEWAYKNDAIITHTSGQYNYCIINNRCINYKKICVFDAEHNSHTCLGCFNHINNYERAPSLICASIEELQMLLDDDVQTMKYFSHMASKEQINILLDKYSLKYFLEWKKDIISRPKKLSSHQSSPFTKLLNIYNLVNNMHIPFDYINNDINTRLKLIAGIIDTNGCITNDGFNFCITLRDNNIYLIKDIKTIVRSLGLDYKKYDKIIDKNGVISQNIYISGNLSIIPTKLLRNKHMGGNIDDKSKLSFSIKEIEYGEYYGFTIDGNHRFLSGDWICLHNCNNQQFLTDNHWMNGMKEWNNVVVVDNVIKEIINDEKFIFVPYVPPGRFEEALSTLRENWQDASCIFAHQEFAGCKMGAIISVEGDRWPIENPYVVSGHIHSRQMPQKNIYYTGSALQHAFGESEKNIIAYIKFFKKDNECEEIDLKLPRKKIVYMDVEDIDDYEVPNTDDSIKVTVSGNYDQFKALKKTKKYKNLLEKGVKVVFKPKKIKKTKKEIDENGEEKEVVDEVKSNGTDFSTILNSIIISQKDPYLLQAYELIVNGKETILDDVIFL